MSQEQRFDAVSAGEGLSQQKAVHSFSPFASCQALCGPPYINLLAPGSLPESCPQASTAHLLVLTPFLHPCFSGQPTWGVFIRITNILDPQTPHAALARGLRRPCPTNHGLGLCRLQAHAFRRRLSPSLEPVGFCSSDSFPAPTPEESGRPLSRERDLWSFEQQGGQRPTQESS